jgi:hypothetical protein
VEYLRALVNSLTTVTSALSGLGWKKACKPLNTALAGALLSLYKCIAQIFVGALKSFGK